MTAFLVTGVRLSVYSTSYPQYEHITHLRLESNGYTSIVTKAEAVDMVDKGYQLIVRQHAYTNPMIVESVHPTLGMPYVRTIGDGTTMNNLMALPRF